MSDVILSSSTPPATQVVVFLFSTNTAALPFVDFSYDDQSAKTTDARKEARRHAQTVAFEPLLAARSQTALDNGAAVHFDLACWLLLALFVPNERSLQYFPRHCEKFSFQCLIVYYTFLLSVYST